MWIADRWEKGNRSGGGGEELPVPPPPSHFLGET